MDETKDILIKKPEIIIVDDHLVFRQGLKSMIDYENIGTVVGEASDGIELLELLKTQKPDLVIMDIDMPNMDGVEATKRAMEKYSDLNIIVLSMSGSTEHYIKMTELGVKGFVIKSSGIHELEYAIKKVMNAELYYSDSVFWTTNIKDKNIMNENKHQDDEDKEDDKKDNIIDNFDTSTIPWF